MKSSNQKLKLLYMAKIFYEKTDENNAVTVADIINELARLDIRAERKSIYDDIEQLQVFGMDICTRKAKSYEYFLASREFELPELKLLVDSVQSSKFITHKKSMELISKIEKLASRENAKKLQRQVFVNNRVKTMNEQIYYNVDKIHEAIALNKQISFRYFSIDVNKEKVYRKNGEKYTESPVSLTWDDENYYLITYKEKYNNFTHYRVDKMDSIEINSEKRVLPNDNFDVSVYAKSVFSMFGGDDTKVSIRFENSLSGVIVDRFGMDVPMIKDGDDHFICHVNAKLSPFFLSWVAGFGTKAKIISPQSVIEEMKKFTQNLYNIYNER